MAAVIIHSDFRAQENKSVIVSTFSPSIYHEVMGLNTKISIFFFFDVEFQASFSTLLFLLHPDALWFYFLSLEWYHLLHI